MLTIAAFIIALGLLIAVHEYGHYRVAVACGVKVLKFSVGFGRPLFTWKPRRQHPGQETEQETFRPDRDGKTSHGRKQDRAVHRQIDHARTFR